MARKRSSLGFLFWTACILLVLVVFLFNKSRIDSVLESTGFLSVLRNRLSTEGSPEVQREPIREDEEADDAVNAEPDAVLRVEPIPPVAAEQPDSARPSSDAPTARTESSPASTASDPGESALLPGTGDARSAAEKTVSVRPAPEKRLLRKSRLYFVTVDDEGRIRLRDVIRPVYYIDSPLTATIGSLLQGPTADELNAGLLSLIPQETELLSAYIKGDTVFLNFNEAFRFNSLGMDGYVAQLKQVVYAATEFPTVGNVQFLVQGKQLEYLSAEGIYIGAPISRSSF